MLAAVKRGWALTACGAVTWATGDVTPMELKTDAGTFVSSLNVVGSVGWNAVPA